MLSPVCRQIFKAMQHPDQEILNLWEPQVKLDEACQWRCASCITWPSAV